MSRLAELRRLSPTRPLTKAEAFRVAELQANHLLTGVELSGPPVPMSVITSLAGITVDYWPNAPVSASSHWTGKTWIIVLNDDEPRVRQRFSLAHELHHVLCHPQREVLYRTHRQTAGRPVEELVADHFSASLLMPRRWVRRAWANEGISTVPALASLFEVSWVAMQYRLNFLGLIDANEGRDAA